LPPEQPILPPEGNGGRALAWATGRSGRRQCALAAMHRALAGDAPATVPERLFAR